MRTTIDLDPDVDARLRALARERRVPLRVVINDALRAGTQSAAEAEPYVHRTFPLGLRPEINLDKAWKLLDEMEDEESIRKMRLRK